MTPETDLFVNVQRFYARQMRMLDEGLTAQWADTFTPDGVFAQNVAPAPLCGRAAIAAAASGRVETLRREGMVRRHWLGMLEVEQRQDGTVWTRYYALAMGTPRDGPLNVYVSTVNEDILLQTADGLRVIHRQVLHDGYRGPVTADRSDG
jgi:hypothetical protein